SKRGHSDDFDAELEAAMAGVEVENLLDDEARAAARSTVLETDSVQQATVVKVDDENVFLTIGGVHEAILPKLQVDTPPAAGEELRVIVSGYNAAEELYEVRLPGAAINVEDWS